MMKKRFYSVVFAVIFTLIGGSVLDGHAQEQETMPPGLQAGQDGKIKFTAFEQTEWRPIIEWFAEQTGLSLELIEQPPEGTFTYQDDNEYTITEAMDLLNDRLMMRGRALVRNQNSLILFDINKGIPSEIIETVTPEDLENRGKYEILRCVFDISGLDPVQIQRDVESVVATHHRRAMVVLASAKQMIVQESGGKLRMIKTILDAARKNSGIENWNLVSLELEHISPEELLLHVSFLGIDRTTLRASDGSINLSFDPLGTRVIVTGQPDKIVQFQKLVEALDVAPTGDVAVASEAPYLRTHAVRGDAELIYNVLGTLLAGRPEVRLDFDEKTGQIFVYGRTIDHELVREAINDVQGSSDDFAVVPIREMDADDMIDILQTMFRQDSLDDTATASGPVFESLIDDRLIVRGTPQEVAQVQAIIAALDVPNVIPESERTAIRHLPLTRSESDQALSIFEQLLPTLGLENSIRVEMPDDRAFRFDSSRKTFEMEGLDDTEEGNEGASDSSESSDKSSSNWRQLDWMIATAISNPYQMIAAPQDTADSVSQETQESAADPQDSTPQDNGTGETSDENTEQQDEPVSVPGAPITIRITDYGLILISEDLVALDRIEQLIYDQLGEVSMDASPTFFFLKYRNAEEAKQMLESYLGVSSSSGGGGGSPLTSMLGGALQNTVGGAAGDMLGGLFGAGDSSAAGDGIFEAEGPIVIEADAKLQSLFVRATVRDMDIIRELIEIIDRPEAPQGPNSLGQTYLISIRFRDPVEVEQHVRQHFATILRSGEQSADAGNQQNQMEQQILRQLLGGRGGRGGGAADVEIEPPKASLSVDAKNRALVVTGPEFLFRQIADLVDKIDQPNLTPDPYTILHDTGGKIPAQTLARMLKTALGDKVEIIDNSSTIGSPTTGSSSSSTSPTPGATSSVMPLSPDAINRLQQLRQQMQRGGGNNGRGGGGNQRGGGGNRGGGGIRGGGDRGG